MSLAPVAPAGAQAVADEAELHFQIGTRAYREGRFEEALEHFLASNRLVPNRNVTYNIARAYERLERWSDAYRYYVDALASEDDPEIIAAIQSALEALAPRVAVVVVETEPTGALIFVDRVDLGSIGVTPRALAVVPRALRVLVRLEGYEPAESELIEPRVGEPAHVRLTLRRIVGTLEVHGDEGAEVRLDDEGGPALCTVPCTVELPPGPHQLVVTREGRERLARQVTIEAGGTTTITAELSELTGSLVVEADERDALVEIDGVARGFTPTVVGAVPVGTRSVRVTRRGFSPIERTVEIREGEQADLTGLRFDPLREVQAASRASERIEDAPASVSIVSAEELRYFQYPTIYEALRGVRGFALTSDSTYHNASIRGLGQPNDYNTRMLLLSDGATLNEDILWQAFLGYDGRVDLGDVERIEIVRGPASVLYGTGAVSGVVNLVPRGQRDDPTGASFAISLAESMVARGRGSFTLRLASDVGMRGGFAFGHSEGREAAVLVDDDPSDGIDRLTPVVARGVERHDAWTLSLRGWAGDLTVQAFYTWREQRIPTGAFGTAFDRPESYYIDQRGLIEIRYEPQLGEDVQLLTRAYANYTGFDALQLYDPSRSSWDYKEDYDGFWLGGEARVVWRPLRELRVSGGFEVAHHPIVRLVSTQLVDDGSGGVLETHPLPLEDAYPYTMIAGAALVDWAPFDALRFSVGARVDGFFPASALARTFAAVSPRAAVIVHPTRDDSLKLMGGRAFRAPSMYEQFYWDGGATTIRSSSAGTPLSPEDFYQAEIEYTHRFDTEWSALVSAHVLYAESFIDTVDAPASPDCVASPDGTGCVVYANVATDQVYAGGDVEVRRELRGGWMFAAQYGLLQARYLEPQATTSGARDSLVPNAPEHFFSMRGVIPVIPELLVIAARLTLEAERRLNVGTLLRSEPAVVADLVISGEVRGAGVQYALGVYNLFDWRYALPVTPFAGPALAQQGRTFQASLSVTF